MTASLQHSPAALRARLSPPLPRPTQVLRESILEAIREAGSPKLVVIRAPAGFGKTTLMQQLRDTMEARSVATAWLTLESTDRDVGRFMYCLACATDDLLQEETLLSSDRSGDLKSPPSEMALALVDRLSELEGPFALFLDEFEALSDSPALEMLRELLQRLPRNGQLVIGSRHLPDLGLGRLRANGQLLEIDVSQLRFSQDEAAGLLLAHLHVPLKDAALRRLYERTEGWPAALWLACVALGRTDDRDAFIERFSGSERSLTDYLREDVVDRQPEEVRAFLLRSSIVKYLSAPLCQALMPGIDCSAVLDRLERDNLFLSPCEGEPGTYQYHSLFANFLRAELERENPELLQQLHRRAAAWYEIQQRPVPAVDHAIQSDDLPYALTLLDGCVDILLEEGRLQLLSRWFEHVPTKLLLTHPRLACVHVWATAFTQGALQALPLLEQIPEREAQDPTVKAHLQALRPMLAALKDRWEEAYAMGQEAVAAIPSACAFADAALINMMASTASVLGRLDEARKLLEQARRSGGCGNEFNSMYAESIDGQLDVSEGRLLQAHARFRLAVTGQRTGSLNDTHGNAWAGVLYATSLYQNNELEQSSRLMQLYLPVVRSMGLGDHMILGHKVLSRIAMIRGDVDRGNQHLTELEYHGHRRQLPRLVTAAHLERSRIHVLHGNLNAARAELERADQPGLWDRLARLRHPGHDHDDLLISTLRVEALAGDPGLVLRRVHAEEQRATVERRALRLVQLQLLKSVAMSRQGGRTEALETLGRLLPGWSHDGFFRFLVDEGPLLGELVREYALRYRDGPKGGWDPLFANYLNHLVAAFHLPPPLPDQVADVPSHLPTEPLTRKELMVLELLAEGYSNPALAEKLFVSNNTVRSHLRSISSKLEAQNRTQAVAIARRLRIIR